MSQRGKWGVVIALSMAMTAPSSSWACAFHGVLPDLTTAHARSLEVAWALRDALDAETIEPLSLNSGQVGFFQVSRLLQEARPLLGPMGLDGQRSVALLLVESGLWTRYRASQSGDRFLAQPHIDGPFDDETVIVTSAAALSAVMSGQITAQQAIDMGVLVLASH
jgi:hypothetical protein